MKIISNSLRSFLAILAFASLCMAQSKVWVRDISVSGMSVRGNPVVVGQVAIDAPSSGSVVVNFDGQCIPSFGDRIILAASDNKNWADNDGNVAVQAEMNINSNDCFSHTRAYQVSAGPDTFYAVAQNYVNTSGNGMASIYATLTATFFPDVPGQPSEESIGISKTNINLRGAPVALDSITISPPDSGFAEVRFDGECVPDSGDRIVLAASDNRDWGANDGSVSVELPFSNGNTGESFSHSRIYPVAGGSSTTFYAVAQNYVNTGGSGIGSVYGSLTVEFFPNNTDTAMVEQQGISAGGNLRGNPVTLGEDVIDAPVPGQVVVRFDGECYSSVGDLIVLAASNSHDWGVNDGNVAVEAVNSAYNISTFSHTRVYNVGAGIDSFFAIGQNYVNTYGTGSASVYGTLTVEYYPGTATAVTQTVQSPANYKLDQNYPNPFNPTTVISYQLSAVSNVTLKVYDVLGREVATLVNARQNPGNYSVTFDGSHLTSGVYFYRLSAGDYVSTKKLVLIK